MATYTVKKGDTLYAIAKQYGTTYQEIAKANGISNPSLIHPGQVLNINGTATPETSTTTAGTATTTPTPTTPETTTPDATTPDANSPTTEVVDTGSNYGEYTPSDAVQQAQQLLDQQLGQKPGEYQSTWQDQLNETIQQILNRDKFSYDLNGDALYQQYKDQYVQQGKLAMMDTMGQAQAMTGGYGNSYAQSAGQQAYQAYLQQLNEVVPELYGMALDQYNQEGQNLLNQFAILGDQEDKDYGRYMDNMNAWLAERDYLAGRYDTERDYDYDKYMNDLAFQYQQDRDKISDEQWQAEFDEAKRQFDQQYALKTGGSSGGSSGGSGSGGGGGGGGSYNNQGYSTTTVKAAQAYIGVTADGKWGANSAAAAKKAGYSSLSEVVDALSGIDRSKTTTTTTTNNSTYSNWSAGTWEAYFAKIRQTEGQAAAIAELNYFTSKGLIPQNMVSAASSGARGGNMGH